MRDSGVSFFGAPDFFAWEGDIGCLREARDVEERNHPFWCKKRLWVEIWQEIMIVVNLSLDKNYYF